MHSTLPTPISHARPSRAAALDAAVRALTELVDLDVGDTAKFGDQERAALAVANELCRRFFADRLQRIADAMPDEVVVDGQRYRRHELGTCAYHGLTGDVVVSRHSYRRVDVRNGPTIVPLALEAGIVGTATPAFAFATAMGTAEMPSRLFERFLRAAHRVPPSRSTTERLGKGIGGMVKQDIVVLETLARAAEELPEGAHAVAIGVDRTSVPMAEERPLSEPPSTPRPRRRKPRVRRAPHPIDVNYRMAYVGTVAIVDREGQSIVTRKYGATAEEGPEELVSRLVADLETIRRKKRLPVVVVQDGAAELWNILRDPLRNAGIEYRRAVDRYHVAQHIAQALEAVIACPKARQRKLDQVLQRLDTSDNTVRRFAKWLEQFWGKPGWSKAQSHYGYLSGWSDCGATAYRSLRRDGFPIASGVTEGACKSLIAARFKRSGQRWQQDGLTAILTLRALLLSDRLETTWPHFMRRFRSEVRLAS